MVITQLVIYYFFFETCIIVLSITRPFHSCMLIFSTLANYIQNKNYNTVGKCKIHASLHGTYSFVHACSDEIKGSTVFRTFLVGFDSEDTQFGYKINSLTYFEEGSHPMFRYSIILLLQQWPWINGKRRSQNNYNQQNKSWNKDLLNHC